MFQKEKWCLLKNFTVDVKLYVSEKPEQMEMFPEAVCSKNKSFFLTGKSSVWSSLNALVIFSETFVHVLT